MLILTFFGLLFIIGILMLIFGKGEAKDGSAPLIVISLVFIVILSLCIQTSNRTQRLIERYNEVRMLREAYTPEKMLPYKDEINKKIYHQNDNIEEAKRYCNSLWVGWFYSKEIANLPKLEFIGPDN